jgi:protein CpxP
MSFRSLIALSALTFILSTGVSSAEPLNPNAGPGARPNQGPMTQNSGGFGGGFMQQLNLNSEQQQQLQGIRAKYQDQIEQQRAAMETARQQLGELMASDASVERLRSQHNEVMRLQQEMANLRFESMLETRQVLTPEQRQELSQRVQERRNNNQQRPRQGNGIGNRQGNGMGNRR